MEMLLVAKKMYKTRSEDRKSLVKKYLEENCTGIDNSFHYKHRII
jgi:hypothetical protein